MSEYEREIELYDYIEVLLRYKWFILAATLVCGALGWYFRPAPPPPLYEADAVLMIKDMQSAGSGDGEVTSSMQTSGFYSALATADDLKQALIDSLDLSMSLVGMDNMLAVEVLDPGIRLTVQAHDRALPTSLVNTWAKLFVERNGDLNIQEVGTYYEWVKGQYETSRQILDYTEASLLRLELNSGVEFMEFELEQLDKTAKKLHQDIAVIEDDVRLIERVIDKEELFLLKGGVDLKEYLNAFDEKHNFQAIQQYLVVTGMDSLQRNITALEGELKSIMSIMESDLNNPLFIATKERLYFAQQELRARSEKRSELIESDTLHTVPINYVDLVIVEQRKAIHSWFELVDRKKKIQGQMDDVRSELSRLREQISAQLSEQQRLQANRAIYSSTVENFSKLLEEARLSRQRAAGDIRVLSRALEVRTVPQEGGQNKTAIAAGAGLLLSAILSLLIEYVRKARALRQSGAVQD